MMELGSILAGFSDALTLHNLFFVWFGIIIGQLVGAIPGIGPVMAMAIAIPFTFTLDPLPAIGFLMGVSKGGLVGGANLIPLLTLGIPGNLAAALIISALMIHGIQPGPMLFQEQGRLIYGLFGTLLMANVLNLLSGILGLRFWARIIRAPESIIFPAALLLCMTGVYLATGGLFGVAVMFIFAFLGYLMNAYGYSVIVFVIAFFLGERFELSLSQSLNIIDGDVSILLSHPVALLLLAMAVFSIYWFGFHPQKGGEG